MNRPFSLAMAAMLLKSDEDEEDEEDDEDDAAEEDEAAAPVFFRLRFVVSSAYSSGVAIVDKNSVTIVGVIASKRIGWSCRCWPPFSSRVRI